MAVVSARNFYGVLKIEDLGSRNGTFVRHQRSWEPVTKVKLRSVAKIRIGQHLETTPGQLLKAAWSMRQR